MHKQIKTPKGRVQDLESLLPRLVIESERNDGIRTYRVIARRMPAPLFPQDAPLQVYLGAAPGQYVVPTAEMLEIIARNAPGDDGLILDVNASDEHWRNLETFLNVLLDRMKAEGYFDHKTTEILLVDKSKEKRFHVLRIKYVGVAFVLTGLIIAFSLWLFPDWARSNLSLVVLCSIAFAAALGVIANWRKALE